MCYKFKKLYIGKVKRKMLFYYYYYLNSNKKALMSYKKWKKKIKNILKLIFLRKVKIREERWERIAKRG
jgi:hypothetical protein